MAVKPLEFNTGVNGFCVARPGGKYIVLFSDNTIHTESGLIQPPTGNKRVIWLDLSANSKIAGTDQTTDNIAHEYNGSAWQTPIKCYSVPRACIYKPDNSLVTVQTPGETGSMGYIQVSDSGQLVKTDTQYHNPTLGIYEYIIRGNVTIGHGGKSSYGENPLMGIVDGIKYLLDRGNCQAIKFYRDAEQCAIAWINGATSKVWFPTVTELKTFPIYNPNTEPPIPPEPPVAIPNNKDTIVRNRAKFNSLPPGNRRGYEVTNASAYDLRNEGAGTFFKNSGTNYNDRSIDIIIYKNRPGDPDGKGATFDVLGDAEGAANPQWIRTSPSGYGDIRNWREPVAPEEPNPEPEPTNPDRDMLIHIRDEINEFLGE